MKPATNAPVIRSMPSTSLPSRMSIVLYFAITCALTWGCLFGANALVNAVPARLVGAVVLLGVFAPGIVALAFTGFERGWSGIVALLRGLIRWRVPVRWYLFAFGFMAAVKLVVAVIYRAGMDVWPRFGVERPLILIAATLLSVLLGGQVGEELGWRGYALPRLASRVGFARASVILGVIWAVWHLPLFFILNGDTRGQSFPVYLVQVTALSVAIAWLFVRTDGSLLLTMIFHAAVNNTKDIVPSATVGAHDPWSLHASAVAWLTAGLLSVCAAGFVYTMDRVRSRSSESLQLMTEARSES